MKKKESTSLFQEFVEVLIALLRHPDLPSPADRIFRDAAVEFANDAGYDSDVESLRDALLKGFAVTSNGAAHDSYYRREQSDIQHAHAEISRAFAVIERNRNYLPNCFYARFADLITEWVGGTSWEADPALLESILPILLSETYKRQVMQGVR